VLAVLVKNQAGNLAGFILEEGKLRIASREKEIRLRFGKNLAREFQLSVEQRPGPLSFPAMILSLGHRFSENAV